MGDSHLKGGLGHAHRGRADARTKPVQSLHGHGETGICLSQQMVLGQHDLVKGQRAKGVGGHHLKGLATDAGQVGGQTER